MQEYPMNLLKKDNMDVNIDFSLDITEDVCPLTFVKTKLQLERMAPGQVLEVRLKGAEPLENVPRSVKDHGDTLLVMEPLERAGEGADAVYRLVIRKESPSPR